eukprot:GSMAST32.ASY1.ANO1.2414.1 assembled CDS
MTNIIIPTQKNFQDIWYAMEDGGHTLATVMNHSPRLDNWSALHVQYISYQILCAIGYLHSHNIIHRDLKPTNILVNHSSNVKLIDFGLSRQVSTETTSAKGKLPMPKRKLTQHVVTRWYRAPEVVVMEPEYTTQIDLWSFGCILGELLQTLEGNQSPWPLFPGRDCLPLSKTRESNLDMIEASSDINEAHQLSMIFGLIGTPSENEIVSIQHELFREIIKKLPKKSSQNLHQLFPAGGIHVCFVFFNFEFFFRTKF